MRRMMIVAVMLLSLLGTVPIAGADEGGVVSSLDLLGEVTIETGTMFDGTEFGGISGLAQVGGTEYLALSDDRSERSPARFYTVGIDVSDGSFDDGDVTISGVTELFTPGFGLFPPLSIDPEGIAIGRNGSVFISSEGDALAGIGPFVNKFSMSGRQLQRLPIDDHFAPTTDSGIRFNLAFESLSISDDNRTLFTAAEGALAQDGPAANVDQPSLARIVQYDLVTRRAVAEYVYVVEPVAEVPDPADSFRVNGLVELLDLGGGYMLAMERSFSVGKGNVVKLYEISLHGATNVIDDDDLYDETTETPDAVIPVSKRLLVDFGDLGLSTVDNLEGLAFGPDLEDGRSLLLVASDNNFSTFQVTQFVAFAVDLAD